MFNFNRPKTVNKLTALFDNGKIPTVEEILESTDLSISLRYEVPELVDFIVPDETNDKTVLKSLLDLALPLKKQNVHHDFRYRRNASNIFSTICGKLQDRLHKDGTLSLRLQRFIERSEMRRTSEFAGHFSRITENYVRHSKGEFIKNNLNIVNNIIESLVDMTPYSNLLANLISDYFDKFDEKNNYFAEIANKIFHDCQEIEKKSIRNRKEEYKKSKNADVYNHWYGLIFTLILMHQQDAQVFDKFDDINLLVRLLYSAVNTPSNTLLMYDSFKSFEIISEKCKPENVKKAIDYVVNKTNIIDFSGKSNMTEGNKYKCMAAFKIFWEEALKYDYTMSLFFTNPYVKDADPPNSIFCTHVIDVFSKMTFIEKMNYIIKLQIDRMASNYFESMKQNKTIPCFYILKLIDILTTPVATDDSDGIAHLLKPSINCCLNKTGWRTVAFKAKELMIECETVIETNQKDYDPEEVEGDFYM
ncbi:hypothetical protein TRFO_08358 [Tritrichomonas foetus]|uniref:Uncharacterized protein n=1 Tax=Tritrichomonas foetus TaxID=1144522 RepID=A0A1J4JPJ0_9EUKA|nr:hypothetical protein TRFO_08358 [Tritrichomonas foetus]|eukprot:OHS99437.1 hypothetical protein TRFO_08358 [Tritrichomonas foetus]